MTGRVAWRIAGPALVLGCSTRLALAQAEGAPAPSTPASTPAPEPVQEVVVHGVRQEPGRQEMTGSEVRQMPGSFGDAFRAIEALPGVIPLVSGLPYFLVRGAPPGNTGFFVDGVRVPALFHLGVGAAVVHPGLVDRVDLYPGGYPARFGRFTGGILTGEIARVPDRAYGEASVRLLDAGALAGTPFAQGRGDVLASGRYGYPGPLLSLFAPQIGLAYWDYQSRVRWRPSERDEIGAFVFGSYDSLSQRNSATGNMDELLGIQFHRVDLRWDRATSPTGSLRVALTLGYDRSAAGNGTRTSVTYAGSTPVVSSTSTVDSIESQSLRLRAEWAERLSPELETHVGSDVEIEPFHVVVPNSGPVSGSATTSAIGTSTGDISQVDVNGGLYAELDWRAAPRVDLRPGVRLDAFTSRSLSGSPLLGGDTGSGRAVGAFDPRLSARWQMTPAVAWLAALGVAHQASNIPFPSPGLQFAQLSRGTQSAFQYSAGAEVKLPLKFTATADAFLQDYTGLADFLDSCPGGTATCTFDGRGVGLELLVRRRLTERFTGWVSYTLSRTDRDAYYQGRWMRRPSEFDRTHVVNVVLAADLGKRWRAGARVMAYSGLPYSTTTGFEGPPDARAPPFVRLDVRLEKKWKAMGGTLTFVFEWLNALLNKETFGASCSYASVPPGVGRSPPPSPQCAPDTIGPITFPSLGLEQAW
jgi:hypothetical protein